jgi:hypothetical protein
MSDVFLYYFLERSGPDREEKRSVRPATLEAIKGRGTPIMESQIVADQTELDAEGFLVAAFGTHSSPVNDMAARIWSLELRAASRENQAIVSTDGVEKYMLDLESRELRKQAQCLKSQLAELRGRAQRTAAVPFIHFDGSLSF